MTLIALIHRMIVIQRFFFSFFLFLLSGVRLRFHKELARLTVASADLEDKSNALKDLEAVYDRERQTVKELGNQVCVFYNHRGRVLLKMQLGVMYLVYIRRLVVFTWVSFFFEMQMGVIPYLHTITSPINRRDILCP